MVLLLVLLSASGCEGPSAGQLEQKEEDFVAFLMETPFVAVGGAAAYYEEFGRWPSSICDLEALQEEEFRDIDWASLRDTIVFEELPDGRLKTISTDPHIRFTITLTAPSDQDENGLSDDGPQAISMRPPKFSG
jgi:hypothetical protein